MKLELTTFDAEGELVKTGDTLELPLDGHVTPPPADFNVSPKRVEMLQNSIARADGDIEKLFADFDLRDGISFGRLIDAIGKRSRENGRETQLKTPHTANQRIKARAYAKAVRDANSIDDFDKEETAEAFRAVYRDRASSMAVMSDFISETETLLLTAGVPLPVIVWNADDAVASSESTPTIDPDEIPFE